jgi:hypothetical protein
MRRFLSMTMVLGIAFLLLVSLVLSAAIAAVGNFVGDLLPGGAALWQVVNTLVSFGVITLLFAAIYKVLPDATIAWSDVWIGAAVTALLFTVGKLLIGLYLGYASVGSTFGAAGSLLVFLVWVYYTAQILFFGAEFTQVYARKYGSRIVPSGGAVALTDEARAKQGIPERETVEQAAAEQAGHSARQPAAAGAPRQLVAAGHRDGADPRLTNGSSRHPNGHGLNGYGPNGHETNGHAVGGATHGRQTASDGSQQPGKRRKRGSGGTKGAPDTIKKLMWAGVVSGSMAVGTIAARRASAEIWRSVFHEDPPTKDV